MQMSVIAWAPPPHTVWRHKKMPRYFYMLMMRRTGDASSLPRYSCDKSKMATPLDADLSVCQPEALSHECACVCEVFGTRQYAGVVFQLCNVSPDVTYSVSTRANPQTSNQKKLWVYISIINLSARYFCAFKLSIPGYICSVNYHPKLQN